MSLGIGLKLGRLFSGGGGGGVTFVERTPEGGAIVISLESLWAITASRDGSNNVIIGEA